MKEKKDEKNIISSINPQTNNTKNGNFKFQIDTTEKNITFLVQNLKTFPVVSYQLKISLTDLEDIKDFGDIQFKSIKKFENIVRKCINNDRYDISLGKDKKCVYFKIKSELFENDEAVLEIPEEGINSNIKSEIESLKASISEQNKKIEEINTYFSDILIDKKQKKEEVAKKSFNGTSMLNEEEKKLISKWIDPNKIIRFNLLYNSSKDGISYSYFHDYCDNAFPIIVIIYDNSGRKFGGYSTQSFRQPTNSYYNCRAPGSFLFNLTNNKKYGLTDENSINAIYRYNSYGPCFGYNSSGTGYYDLYISQSCNSSSCYCYKYAYDTGSTNLLGQSGQTSFLVSSYEAYQVIFE